MTTRHPRLLLACATFCLSSSAISGTTGDPTQPSAKLLAAQPGTGDATRPKVQPMETQVIVYSAERQIAVVDGVIFRIGDIYNGERLVAMKPHEVHWKHAEGAAPDARPAIVKKFLREDK